MSVELLLWSFTWYKYQYVLWSISGLFKHKNLKGKVYRRVDRCLVNLLKFSRDKVFEQITKLTISKNSAKLKRVHRSHLESMKVPFTNVLRQQNESTWVTESVVGKRKYF